MPTTQDIQNWLAANPGLSNAQIASAMDQYGVTPAQMAAATGLAPQAVQARYTAGIASLAPTTAAPSYFQTNPDVAAAYQQNSYGMTPEQFAAYHYQNYGKNEGRAAPTAASATPTATTASAAPTTTTTTTSAAPTLFGNLANVATNWGGGNTPIPLNDPRTKVANQILSQGLTSQWTGEGAGSPEANALYMADTLVKAGITDIKQFGQTPVYKPAQIVGYSSNGSPIYGETAEAESGTVATPFPDQSKVTMVNGVPSVQTGTNYINKATGQVVGKSDLDWSGDNLWSGTYAGDGKTGYGVQFDAQGNPYFYTQYGGDTSDRGTINTALMIASMVAAPGLSGLIGGATGLTGAGLAAATGATMGGGIAALTGQDVLKGAALGGLGGYAGSQLSQALNSGITDAATLQAAADADLAGGLLPEYGTNAAYDTTMANLMANSPGAVQQLQNIVDSQVGGLYGPDNIDVGGGWNPAGSEATVGSTYGPDNIDVGGGWNPATTTPSGLDTLPQATYSNEGRNYPTEGSTQGSGGSPVNASTAAGGVSLPSLAKLAALAGGTAGVASLVNNQGSNTISSGDASGPLSGYKFDPSKFQATTPDPAMFRPGAGIVTVADALRAQQAQPTINMAKGGSTKPTYSTKAQLAAMNPWERSVAELNNAAYAARMPTGTGVPQAGITQLGQFARGGIADLGSYSDGGRMLKGGGDGMSDSIPATIGGKQPARLADGEFVIPADVVSGLGNGSTDAGARQLYKMLDRVRQSRTGTKKQGKEINAQKHMPA